LSPPEKIEAVINIAGRVQGVGFRPFIYRKAVTNQLNGYVINLGDAGVEVVVEGSKEQIDEFLIEVQEEAPEVSEIESINLSYRPYRGRYNDFIIDKSRKARKAASGIYPPDIGICPQCLQDMDTPNSRWYEYPFTACAWCGPRFTSVKELPYDRERTHMHEFPMCENCHYEYYNPLDRRFDAQGITCSKCGPQMNLFNKEGKRIETDDIYQLVAELLLDGNIFAVKGIGGIHLASLATDESVLVEFRRRKNREYQPFAIMAPDLSAIMEFAYVNDAEENALTSWRKPIVLLKKKHRVISDLVAPGLDTVGVMLPYTGIQTMIFKRLTVPALVMTSGNKRGMPMAISNQAALTELGELTDYFLLHDREIVNRSDDSVIRIINGKNAFTRRSRGYVPDPIKIPFTQGTAYGLGAELRNAGSIATNGNCFMTQYLGDITTLESLDFEKKALERMRDLLNITCNPDVITCDLHPGYMTSHLGDMISQELNVDLVKSQHHHAHIVSVAVEHGIDPDEEILGLALDGAGYGQNGAIWGGELLKTTFSEYERVGHLEELPMPGGDLCAYYPFRMLIAALSRELSDEEIRDITGNHVIQMLPHGYNEQEIILKQSRKQDITVTSSTGRILDSISALLGLCGYRHYEGEPAMRLESFASQGNTDNINYPINIIENKNKMVLNTSEMLYNCILLKNMHKYQDIAVFGQKYICDGFSEMIGIESDKSGINSIGLSGGVFVNEFIRNRITEKLERKGLSVLNQFKVPPGDGGSALGQVCIGLKSVM
jgi:hydrogenase maturation protein HypF